ncbi:MAG TPA: hypothetical protein VGI20_08185 [Rhizomicrobium sp.]
MKLPCSDRYNTVALNDPQGDGWLVWAMAATNDPKAVVIGGHYRFTISKDGRNIQQGDALSRACMTLTRPALRDATEQGVFVSQLVALTPVETHLFASLEYKLPLFVGTLDGKTWKIDQGQVSEVESDAPGVDGFNARIHAGYEENCQSLLSKPTDGALKYFTGSSMKVIELTEHDNKFTLDTP